MEPISNILFGLFRGTPRHAEWMIACLEGAWRNLVGDRIAAVCRPVRFEDSRLTVEILDPAWDKPLRAMMPELLLRIRSGTGGEVQDLRLVLP